MSRLLDLGGRTAVVTGGCRGIGRAIVEILAAHGADVLLTSRDGALADQTARAIAADSGRRILGATCDVRDSAQISSLYKLAFAEFKHLDILVNNAGVLGDALIGMIPDTLIQETLDTNVKGVVGNIQGAARLMRRNKSGSIINIASIIGVRGNPGQLVYAASKSAVVGATLAASKELAPHGIRVNAIAPGYIKTDMIAHLPEVVHEERMKSIAMGRIGMPEDIARATLFLASDLSAYVTGQVIGVDGGMML